MANLFQTGHLANPIDTSGIAPASGNPINLSGLSSGQGNMAKYSTQMAAGAGVGGKSVRSAGALSKIVKNPKGYSQAFDTMLKEIQAGRAKNVPKVLKILAESRKTGKVPNFSGINVEAAKKEAATWVKNTAKAAGGKSQKLLGPGVGSSANLPAVIDKSVSSKLNQNVAKGMAGAAAGTVPKAAGKGWLKSVFGKMKNPSWSSLAALAVIEIGAGYFISEFAKVKNESNMKDVMSKYGSELQQLAMRGQHAEQQLADLKSRTRESSNALMSQMSPSYQPMAQPEQQQLPPEILEALTQQTNLASGQTLI